MFRVQQAGPPTELGAAARMSDLLLRVWIFNNADFVISSPRSDSRAHASACLAFRADGNGLKRQISEAKTFSWKGLLFLYALLDFPQIF